MTQTVATMPAPSAPGLVPRVDVFEDESGLTLLADLPGVPKDKLTIDVDGDTLKIEGEIAAVAPGGQYTHTEFSAARYQRAFTLSRELDSTRIEAESNHGVLKLRIPKREKPQPQRVEIALS
jgi:HSP20 family protein